MYTECSSCHTYFKITSAQLKAADGKVRCGSCGEIFNALDSLVEVVPPLGDNKPTNKDAPDSSPMDVDVISSAEEFVNELSVEEPAGSTLGESSLEGLASEHLSEPLQESTLDVDEFGSLALEEHSALDNLIDEASVAVDAEAPAVEGDGLQEEINKDIDDALNDLFNDDELKVQEQSIDVGEVSASPQDDLLSEISAFNESELTSKKLDGLEPAQELDNQFSSLDVSEQITSGASEASVDAAKESTFSARESRQTEPDPGDFDLGDSVLASEPVSSNKDGWDDSSSISAGKDEKPTSDDYVLKELQEAEAGPSSAASKIAWIGLIFLLLLILLVQFAYLKRAELVKYPSARPALEVMCSALSLAMTCEIPEPRDTGAIALVERNVVSHPNAQNALLISSVIKNNAPFTQPYPKLVLTFSDINQKVVARRTFVPEEYLTKDVDISAGMASSIPVKVMLEIVDPGQEAVNFEFDFR